MTIFSVNDMMQRMEEIDVEDMTRETVRFDLGDGLAFEMLASNLQDALDEIFGQPSHRQHGRWILEEDADWMGGAACRCSVCSHAYAVGAFFGIDEANHCPTCGAVMDGGDDDE